VPAYHIHLKKPKDLPFRSFYLCTDSEAASDVAASIQVLIELPAKPYLNKIRACPDFDGEFDKYLTEAQDGTILIPMLLTKEGFPKYVSAYSPSSARRQKEYFWKMRVFSRGEEIAPSERIYESRVGLIVNGKHRGSPCSHCPRVLESLGNEATCTFGLNDCRPTLNLKGILNED